MKLFTELILRAGLIVAIIDSIFFYVIRRRHEVITLPLWVGMIILTIVVLIINIWYALHRNGII